MCCEAVFVLLYTFTLDTNHVSREKFLHSDITSLPRAVANQINESERYETTEMSSQCENNFLSQF